MIFTRTVMAAALLAAWSAPVPARPLADGRTAIVAFDASPFPYRGRVPGQGKPFLDAADGDRLGHTSPRGGVYFEDTTYSDRRVLLHVPAGFDPDRPALIVLFLHGNQATLARDVRDRQGVPRQLAASGVNAVLVAPQLAVDALDSSAGRFWEPGFARTFLSEAAGRLADLAGDGRLAATFERLPVVLVAYSGGYLPAAFTLSDGGIADRLAGVILLDALFGEIERFADWLARRPPAFLVSAYSAAGRAEHAALQRLLAERRVAVQTVLPSRLARGDVALVAARDDAIHRDFVTRAWTADPLRALLARIPGHARRASGGAGR